MSPTYFHPQIVRDWLTAVIDKIERHLGAFAQIMPARCTAEICTTRHSRHHPADEAETLFHC
jgi:hypothetical protein